eukprot:scaffold40797_cov21-Phaeocystis_antarctica.AAC.1
MAVGLAADSASCHPSEYQYADPDRYSDPDGYSPPPRRAAPANESDHSYSYLPHTHTPLGTSLVPGGGSYSGGYSSPPLSPPRP